jgi:hypothetical protein
MAMPSVPCGPQRGSPDFATLTAAFVAEGVYFDMHTARVRISLGGLTSRSPLAVRVGSDKGVISAPTVR